jgi:hypothetical protein
VDLPAVTGGFLSPPSLRSSSRPPQPTGPWLRTGYVVPFLLATPTRFASLAASRRFPRITGYTAGLCPTPCFELPARPSLLWVRAPSLRAVTPTPRGGTRHPSLPSLPLAFLHRTWSRLLYFPSPQLRCGLCLRRCSVRCPLRRARLLALLGWSDLELCSGRRGRLHPSLPEAGHPDPESGITTQPSWGELWPDLHRLEHCRYRLHVLSQSR